MEEKSIYLANLLAKYIEGSITDQEKKELELNLSESDIKEQLAQYETDSVDLERQLLYFESKKSTAWKDINRRSSRLSISNIKKVKILKFVAVAASIVLVLVSSILLYQKNYQRTYYTNIIPDTKYDHPNDISPGGDQTIIKLHNGDVINLENKVVQLFDEHSPSADVDAAYNISEIKSIITPAASNTDLVLPDGTKVFLNASSVLTIGTHEGKFDRRVTLKGEAYFDVSKSIEHKFQVYMDKDTVTVYGTSFNINNYEETNTVTLVEGRVSVSDNKGRNLFLLPGNQSLSGNIPLKIRKVDVRKFVSWKDGYFFFKQDDLKDVLEQVARWYDIDIALDPSIANLRLTGTISKGVTLAEAVSSLKDASGLHFKINKRTLNVTK